MKNKVVRICSLVLAAYLLLGAAFFFIAGDSLHYTSAETSPVTPKATLGELLLGQTIEQTFVCEYDTLTSLGVRVATSLRKDDFIHVELSDKNGVLAEWTESTRKMNSNETYQMLLPTPLENARNKELTLRLTSLGGFPGNAVSFYYGNTVDSGRFSVAVEIADPLLLNGQTMQDSEGNECLLCLTVGGMNHHFFGRYYWIIYGVGALLLLLFLLSLWIRHRKGKHSFTLSVIGSIHKYSFLIRQLVSRDFKTKYKRSVLGMLWSFLNPLLTMSIQYLVFSTIFKSDIPNFATYLLCGIICFNFFNEATGMCLMSIVGNASLINKVYVPKYIYPFSRTLSSSINLLLSMIPLLLMLLVTRTPITPAILLMPFALLMLFLVSYGVGMLLATMMVFFRDTQFLWGIFSMLLMYMTPVFYPESIIPAKILPIFKLNPLYHIIRFMRSILIDGVSLEPKAYLYCIILCLIPFIIGCVVFRKNQDKFVLNI